MRNLKSLFSYRLMYYLFVTHGDVLNNHYPDCITNSCRAVEPKTLSKLLAVCHTSSIYIGYYQIIYTNYQEILICRNIVLVFGPSIRLNPKNIKNR